MPRLFIAIELPPAITAELARLQPRPAPGLRLSSAEQMHITLHFLGEADVLPIKNALQSVAVPAFSLQLAGLGQFRSRGDNVALWAGVEVSEELLALHAGITAVLADAGTRLQSYRYKPHITLARCKPGMPAALIPAFLAQQFSLPFIPVTGFGLYSSTLTKDGPLYCREQWFALQA